MKINEIKNDVLLSRKLMTIDKLSALFILKCYKWVNIKVSYPMASGMIPYQNPLSVCLLYITI